MASSFEAIADLAAEDAIVASGALGGGAIASEATALLGNNLVGHIGISSENL